MEVAEDYEALVRGHLCWACPYINTGALLKVSIIITPLPRFSIGPSHSEMVKSGQLRAKYRDEIRAFGGTGWSRLT